MDKAHRLPQDIRWHFIGHLQSNKAKILLSAVRSLAVIETVDSEKLANKVSAAVVAENRDPLSVMVQVNTSGEESKSGVEPGAPCVALAKHIHDSCPGLRLAGLMTIGQPGKGVSKQLGYREHGREWFDLKGAENQIAYQQSSLMLIHKS